MNNENHSKDKTFDVIIVGAGASGLGVGIVLKKLGIHYVILEKDSVGSSFRKWPQETRFISPSFTGNFFKMPDLNAISPETSPAFHLLTEHPSGNEFARYLEAASEFYELKIEANVEVKIVQKGKDLFTISTSNGDYTSRFVIWAAGEYQYPKKMSFEGDHLCIHYSEISSFSDVQGDDIIVVGAYESGFDSAVNFVKSGKAVTLLDSANFLDLVNSDSSYSLSPFTRDRIKEVIDDITYYEDTRVKKVELANGVYTVTTTENKTFTSKHKPLNCTGFDSSLALVESLFEFEDNYPVLNDFDESTKTENVFLVGPQVKHGNALFCFIYKYRQRFAIVGENIAMTVGIPSKMIEDIIGEYTENNFYLQDLSCCGNTCAC
jgi:cation diffusion facilitator CzcD-associated flavoprotein CzcO